MVEKLGVCVCVVCVGVFIGVVGLLLVGFGVFE